MFRDTLNKITVVSVRMSSIESNGEKRLMFYIIEISMKLKSKFYKSIVKPTMLNGLEYWAVNKKTELRSS